MQIHELKNDRLLIELEGPGDPDGGSRFDRLGRVTQVTLDGRTCFCTVESTVPGEGTGGAGLCGEFGIFTPVGYADARAGEFFPKLGVGLLRKPDEEPYAFYRTYDVDPFPVEVHTGNYSIRFSAEIPLCHGYSAYQEKTFEIEDNSLTVNSLLRNTGNREIVTEEYCHNFFSINDSLTGPGYFLEMPYKVGFEQETEAAALTGNRVTFPQTVREPFYCRLSGFETGTGHTWKLVHVPAGAAVSETNDFLPSRVALWGSGHVLSPEVFIEIRLRPGEQLHWMRRYEFFDTGAGKSNNPEAEA